MKIKSSYSPNIYVSFLNIKSAGLICTCVTNSLLFTKGGYGYIEINLIYNNYIQSVQHRKK